MKQVCTVCATSFRAKRLRKYCSKACEVKGWKLNNRSKYLAGKKQYRAAHTASKHPIFRALFGK